MKDADVDADVSQEETPQNKSKVEKSKPTSERDVGRENGHN